MTDIEVTLNAWEINSVNALAVQGESCGRTIKATLIDRKGITDGSFNAVSVDRPIDLTNATAKLYCIKSDGTKTNSDGTVTDATNGKVSFVLPYQATTKDGDVACQIVVFWPDNSTIKTIGLSLKVQPSDLDGAAESTSEWPVLVEALNEVKASDAKAQQAAVEAQAADDKANDAVTKADQANATATDAAQKATDATNTAIKAANDLQNYYQMLDPTTGKTDYVTNVVKNLEAYIFSGAITAQEYDDLNITAQDYDNLNITALDYDTRAKAILSGR